MKIILIGYEGSKEILSASSFLLRKYLPASADVEVEYLNFGSFDSTLLHIGRYISLDSSQIGGVSSWSSYMKKYLESIDDEFVIFSLDDYLMSGDIDWVVVESLLAKMQEDSDVVCCKLGISPTDRPHEYRIIENDIYVLNDSATYKATTQMCIWRKDFLISVLSTVNTPWEFEIDGSRYINSTNKKILGSMRMPFRYPEPSALSGRHPQMISVFGNRKMDIDHLISVGALKKDKLIMGQWVGHVLSYSYCENDHSLALSVCPSDELGYYRYMYACCHS